jgi:predicted transposase YdaD
MAVQELERINADKQYRQLLETREKSELVFRTLLTEARQDGLEDGRREGIQKGHDELIQKMLEKGKTPEEISELTEVSLQDVLRIADESQKKSASNRVAEDPAPFARTKPRRTRNKL